MIDMDVNLRAAGRILDVDLETSAIQDTATTTNLEQLDKTLNPELQDAKVEDMVLHD